MSFLDFFKYNLLVWYFLELLTVNNSNDVNNVLIEQTSFKSFPEILLSSQLKNCFSSNVDNCKPFSYIKEHQNKTFCDRLWPILFTDSFKVANKCLSLLGAYFHICTELFTERLAIIRRGKELFTTWKDTKWNLDETSAMISILFYNQFLEEENKSVINVFL